MAHRCHRGAKQDHALDLYQRDFRYLDCLSATIVQLRCDAAGVRTQQQRRGLEV